MPHDGNMQRVLICAPYSSAVQLCKGSKQSKTNSSVITKYRAVGLLGKTCRNRVAHLHLQQTDKLTCCTAAPSVFKKTKKYKADQNAFFYIHFFTQFQ